MYHLPRIQRVLRDGDTLANLQTLTLIVLGYAGFLRWNNLHNIFADELVIHCE